jgi:predicted DNA-binding protein YlxM (UPF0122 family)
MRAVPINGLEQQYLVTEGGRIYSQLTGQYLKCNPCTQGYPMAKLFLGNKRYLYRRVHRLVAEHFIPNPNNLPVVNHLDGNKLNPHKDNLEWCTYLENTAHAYATGLSVPKSTILTTAQLIECSELYDSGVSIRDLATQFGVSRNAIEGNIIMSEQGRKIQLAARGALNKENLSQKISQFTMTGLFIREWDSMIEAAKALGINQGNISNACAGRSKSAGGFKWQKL